MTKALFVLNDTDGLCSVMPKYASSGAQEILSRNRRLTRKDVFYTATEETAIEQNFKIKWRNSQNFNLKKP